MNSMKNKFPTQAEVREIVDNAWNEWCDDKGSKEAIAAFVRRRLDNGVNDIVLSLLGFEKNSWNGEWRIDHCNGRSGQSVIGDYLRTNAEASVRKWLDNIGELPELPKATKKEVMNEYLSEYRRYLAVRLRELANERARTEAKRMIDEVIGKGDDQ